ncbi:MAG TPA: ECF-type sigma factor [Longimicrobiales bacterium]|nr:ECF-type sigma factor [Longimicrobiales bacterium]
MTGESITVLLDRARAGEANAADNLFTAVYDELRHVAHAQRRRWQGDDTLNTTALIHEAYIRLAGRESISFINRTHFFATAAQAMRQVLINYAERRSAAKRGGGATHVTLEEDSLVAEATFDELLALDELLTQLEVEDARRARIVECRVFGGMTVDEVAQALDLSAATVKREWRIASTRLYQRLRSDIPDP